MANDFAWRLQRWRMHFRLLQKEAAAIFEVPTGTYRTWEKGSRTPKKLTMMEIERRLQANGCDQQNQRPATAPVRNPVQ